ncbi:MAG TPA: glycosyltransferase family 9 protein [Candidatus Eremiobacteraceae bacterium]|nr:glycosyltransferase family 9 protein [Candidatus Eremiobacteraceae bacterium]
MSSQKKQKTIVYGAFKAMGDLLNAAPVIASQLNAGHRVKLLLFPNPALEEFSHLIDFGSNHENLEVVHLPVSGHFSDFQKFFSRMRRIQPDLVWISPHAPGPSSSWKIPLLLWFTKKLFWRETTTLAGAESERLSVLFDVQVRVDRNLPMMEREWVAFSMLGNGRATAFHAVTFVEAIGKCREEQPKYDLLIHPGANAPNRTWPYDRFGAVVCMIPEKYRVAVLGLPQELELMRTALPPDRGIQFLTGTLQEAISAIARARVVLAMDSGAAHFAQVLHVPTVALFGKSDPQTIISREGSVMPIYERKFPCQPCGRAVCSQPEVYCMNTITAETVANALRRQLEPKAGERR